MSTLKRTHNGRKLLRESSMQFSNTFKTLLSALVALAAMYMCSSLAPAQNQPHRGAEAKGQACPNDDSGLQLPAGFCATVFADDIGHARHMVVASSGVLYVNTWSGRLCSAKNSIKQFSTNVMLQASK